MAYRLANYPVFVRYKTPKTNWQAMRLGLYQTVIDKRPIVYTPKAKVVRLIAQLKRFVIADEDLQTQIWQILSNQRFKKYHKEFVKETFYLHPNIFTKYFLEHKQWLKDDYYLGLVLSYASYNNIITNFKLDCDNFFNNIDTLDKKCLYSNIYLKSDSKKLENLNKILSTFELLPLTLKDTKFCINNLSSLNNDNKIINKPMVSILVTAYNAKNTIQTCILSLINQTYANIEIIVINDNSDDDTLTIIQDLAKKDGRIKCLNLPKNTGTFVAKSIGAMYATGEFLTCQDSDDFAHPQKIAIQVQALLKNKNLIATTSYWLRIDSQGNYYARQYYPFLRQNPASPLFRREQVQNDIGLWHSAWTGADSEFWARLKLYYGDDKILAIKQPLTFASHLNNSLMNSKLFGVHNQKSALARLDYWENWQLWHIDCLAKKQSLKMPNIQDQLNQKIFQVPQSLIVNADNILYNLNHHQLS